MRLTAKPFHLNKASDPETSGENFSLQPFENQISQCVVLIKASHE